YARPRAGEPGREFLRYHHAAVFSAGAAHRKGHEQLAAALIAAQRDLEHVKIRADEFLGPWLTQYVVLDGPVKAVQWRELGSPVRVGEAGPLRHHGDLARQAVFETERPVGHASGSVASVGARRADTRLQFVDI